MPIELFHVSLALMFLVIWTMIGQLARRDA